MKRPAASPDETLCRLDEITTRWSQIKDPLQFVYRYSTAIRAYLQALVHDPQKVEEIIQEFLVKFLQTGLVAADSDRGRFRDYLKVAVRNAALTFLRKKHPRQMDSESLARLEDPAGGPAECERQWREEWRRCVLDKAWRSLDAHQQQHTDNLFYTVVRLASDHPRESSQQLAERASRQVGRPLKPAAFRKQLSRARRMFAEEILCEVEQTVENDCRADIEEELIELGLLEFIRGYLPDGWRQGR